MASSATQSEVQGQAGQARALSDQPLQLIVVTPEATVLEAAVDFAAVPLFDGEIGILPGRSPMIGRLGYGELRFTKDGGQASRYYVDGGFVQVADNVVSVLTNRSLKAADIDRQAAQEQLAAARARKAHSPEMMAIRDRLERQARAQIRLADR